MAARPEGLSDNEWRGVAPRYIVVGTVPRDVAPEVSDPPAKGGPMPGNVHQRYRVHPIRGTAPYSNPSKNNTLLLGPGGWRRVTGRR